MTSASRTGFLEVKAVPEILLKKQTRDVVKYSLKLLAHLTYCQAKKTSRDIAKSALL